MAACPLRLHWNVSTSLDPCSVTTRLSREMLLFGTYELPMPMSKDTLRYTFSYVKDGETKSLPARYNLREARRGLVDCRPPFLSYAIGAEIAVPHS
jgi:hypothetical protein